MIGGDAMVTWNDLFQYTIVLLTLAAVIISIVKKTDK